MVRYSNDNGLTWQPIAVGLKDEVYEADLDRLPGGNHCKFQVIASNILQSAVVETDSFVVKKKRHVAVISLVEDHDGDRPSNCVELAGSAYSPDGCAEERDLNWYSNIQGHLGSGSYLIANNLTPGEHVISLVAPDGMGGQTRAEYRVHVPTN